MGDEADRIDYEYLFRILPGPHIVVRADDPEFTIVDENEAHAKLAFVKYGAAIGQPILTAFPDTSEAYRKTGTSALLESFRRVIETAKPDTLPLLHYDLKDRHGRLVKKIWRVTHYPIGDKTGAVRFVYQATEDITSEHEAGDKLQKARAQLNSALAIGLVSTWNWDIKRDVVLGDRNLAKRFGVSAAAAAEGLPINIFIDSVHPDDRERVAAAIQKSVKNKTDYEIEYRTVDKTGAVFWVIGRGTVECDEAGNAEFFLGVLVDITERKQAEAERETATSMFEALFESTILSVVQADIAGHILQANRTFLKTFGYTAADLKRGMTSQMVTPPHARHLTARIYDSLSRTGEMQPLEKEYVRKDGSIVPMLVGAAMQPGSKDHFIAFMLDISENKRLSALNIAKDEFIALASHQLRTPATAVKQYLGILIDGFAGPISDQQRDFLRTAYNSNERQLTIINDLLKTAQLDSRGYALQRQTTNLVPLIAKIIKDFDPVVQARSQQLLFTYEPATVVASVDASELQLAIINLVENASKYTPDGKQITVALQRDDQQITITISDEGVGIAKQDIGLIFEKFTRINNPLSDTVDGSGLGLYWVKRIVALHGGTLRVKSALKQGTTFTIGLPA